MKAISRVVVSLIYFNSLVRDTLEYSIHRDKFDINFYNYKKNGIINEPLLNTPLKAFIDGNGEKGQELGKKIADFGEVFYSDKSTILRPEGDNVRVDHNQNVTIFEKVVPLHEELEAVVRLHERYAKEHNDEVEESVANLIEIDEKFYRSVLLFSLSAEIMRKFEEFNKAMNEAKGEKNPAASFAENELNSLCKMFYLSKANATCKASEYTDVLDAVEHMIEMMNGRRELPKGQNFRNVFSDVNAKVNEFLLITEEDWKKAYQPAIEEMIKDNQAARAAAEKKEESK